MGNPKRTIIEPISPSSFDSLDQATKKIIPQSAPIYQMTRLTVDADHTLTEAIKDYSYWSGMTQREAIVYILENFFKENPPKPRPLEVLERAAKRREKDGRRRNSYK